MPSASLAADFRAAGERRRTLVSPLTYLQAAGVTPDPWQQRVLESRARQLLLLCSRQSGKSFVTAALVGYTAMTQRNRDVLVVARAQRQAMNLLRTVVRLFHDAGMPVPALAESAQTLELVNGSRVVALPGSSESIRSFGNLALLAVDEAAFVPDELYLSVRPMLAVGAGRLVALSSAHGTRGWFYESWQACELAAAASEPEPWERHRITALECPRITPEFLAEERRAMGEWWFEQEYLCRFLDAETQLFKREDVDAAMDEDTQQWPLPAW